MLWLMAASRTNCSEVANYITRTILVSLNLAQRGLVVGIKLNVCFISVSNSNYCPVPVIKIAKLRTKQQVHPQDLNKLQQICIKFESRFAVLVFPICVAPCCPTVGGKYNPVLKIFFFLNAYKEHTYMQNSEITFSFQDMLYNFIISAGDGCCILKAFFSPASLYVKVVVFGEKKIKCKSTPDIERFIFTIICTCTISLVTQT